MLCPYGRGFGIVRDHQDRLSQPPIQVAQQVQHGFRVLAVQIAGRLVGQQNRRMIDDGPRDRDPLLLAAGERRGLVMQPVRDAQQIERLLKLRIVSYGRCRQGAAPPRYCPPPRGSAAG